MFRRLVLALALLSACSAGPQPTPRPQPRASAGPVVPSDEATPTGRLPPDVKPTHYALELSIDPEQPRFSGTVIIDVLLSQARRHLWLHGQGLEVSEAAVTPEGGSPSTATYTEAEAGAAKLSLSEPLPAGKAQVKLSFSGDFSTRTNSLYRVTSAGESYAFTQMEPVWARQAFPCFDEPAFKTPWDVALVVPKGDVAIANTRETGRAPADDGMVRVTYATTEPLPTYLIAFAVGPLDVVEAPPIPGSDVRAKPLPFRGVTAKGRGKDMAYALKHTPAILAELEDYFGIAYPYDKLDIIAVPDKGGAMENAGAITFREWLLLFEESSASYDQRRAFAYVMAHELAHQWFGNLVTMPWWDDIWLNEAFATWMGYRAIDGWRPDYDADVQMLTRVLGAMGRDRLVNARQIRQPVTRNDDIHNAFDRITYRKGGGVLAMFEQWMGAETFRKGLQGYMKEHRHGSATADDLMVAFSKAAGKDVSAPFKSFLFQPGLPEVRASVSCEGEPTLTLKQGRYLPLGSTAENDQTWQIPVCFRYRQPGEKAPVETCELLDQAEEKVALKGCPVWLMPNANAAGYYTWSLDPASLKKLVAKGLPALNDREKLSFGSAVRNAFDAGRIDAEAAFEALLPLAADPNEEVARAPMGMFYRAHRYLGDDEALRQILARRAKATYAPVMAELGYQPKPKEPVSDRLRRERVLGFMIAVGGDEVAQRRAAKLGADMLNLNGDALRRDVVDPNLAGLVAMAFGMTATAEQFDALRARLKTERDDAVRGHLLAALSSPRDESLGERAMGLVLDPDLRVQELTIPLRIRMGYADTRPAAWEWLKTHLDAVLPRMAPRRAAWLPDLTTGFCAEEEAAEVQATFGPVASKVPGGPRELAKALESIRLCAAARAEQLPGLKRYLGG